MLLVTIFFGADVMLSSMRPRGGRRLFVRLIDAGLLDRLFRLLTLAVAGRKPIGPTGLGNAGRRKDSARRRATAGCPRRSHDSAIEKQVVENVPAQCCLALAGEARGLHGSDSHHSLPADAACGRHSVERREASRLKKSAGGSVANRGGAVQAGFDALFGGANEHRAAAGHVAAGVGPVAQPSGPEPAAEGVDNQPAASRTRRGQRATAGESPAPWRRRCTALGSRAL